MQRDIGVGLQDQIHLKTVFIGTNSPNPALDGITVGGCLFRDRFNPRKSESLVGVMNLRHRFDLETEVRWAARDRELTLDFVQRQIDRWATGSILAYHGRSWLEPFGGVDIGRIWRDVEPVFFWKFAARLVLGGCLVSVA